MSLLLCHWEGLFVNYFVRTLVCFCLLFALPAAADLTTSVTIDTNGGNLATVYPGQQTALKITLSNSNDSSSVTAVAFNSVLPAGYPNGLKISATATYECADPSTVPVTVNAGVGTLTATLNDQTISLSGGVIPARDNSIDGICTIIIPVVAGTSSGGSATYTYQIADQAVSGSDDTGTVRNSGQVSQAVNILGLNKPAITKNFNASTLRLGDNATPLTITLSNNNPVAIENFSITDTFPTITTYGATVQVAATPAATATCTSGANPVFAPLAGDVSVSATGTIPANGSCTLRVDTEARTSGAAYDTGNKTNRIDKDTDFSNDLGIAAESDATDNIRVLSPLTVSKSFANSAISSGHPSSFTITLNNAANGPLTISSFTDSPIDGVAGTSYGLVAKLTGSSNSCGGILSLVDSGDGITLTGGTIPANSNCSITVAFDATNQTTQVPVSYTNVIAQGAVGISSPSGIVSQTRSASILVADELRVLKSARPSIAAPGNPVEYIVTVQNFSNNSITAVRINDTLPAGFAYLTGIINGNDFNPTLSGTGCAGLGELSTLGTGSAQFTLANLPARNSINSPSACDISFWAMVDPNAGDNVSTVNTIAAGDVCYSSSPEICNGASASSTSGTRTEASVLTASKQFNGTTNTVTLSEGTIATLTVTLSNLSANPLSSVSLADTFPTDGTGQLQVASPANASTTCGGTVTAIPGTSSLALNGGAVPARDANGTGPSGTCVVSVDVIGPAGTYNNTATVAATQTYADNSTGLVNDYTSNNARIVYLSALSAQKSFIPAAVATGGRSRVTVRLDNSGAVALTDVTVTDPLPTGMVLAVPVNASTSCAGSPAFTSATPGANVITLEGASIAGLGSCDMIFDVVATGTSDWTNTIPTGNITANGGVRNVNPVSAVLTYQPATPVSVAKTTNPSTLTFPGETSQLTISFTNGNTAVTNMTVADYFTLDGTLGTTSNGMVVAPTTNASTTCPGGLITAAPGADSVAISGVSLNATESCELTVNVTSNTVGGIVNYIPIGALTSDQGISNNGQASTSLSTQNNVGVQKKFTPNVVKPGERSRLRITFYNPTVQPLASIAVVDTLPSGVTVPAGANPTTSCSGATVSSPASNQVAVAGGNIPAASGATPETCYAEIDVVVASQGEYTNVISAGSVTATAGGYPVNNAQPTSDVLYAKTPLEIHKAFADKTLDAGNPVGFTTASADALPGAAVILTFRIDNANTQALTGVGFIDALPANVVVAQTPNASTSCSGGFVDALASATSIRVSGATVPAGSFCTVTVDVLSNVSGSYTNTLSASAVSTNEGVTNDEPTNAQLNISTPPGVDKQFAPSVISANGTSLLTVLFANDNDSAITLTSAFTDTLPTAPGNIIIATPANVGGSCPGAVTAIAGSGSVTYANGAAIPVGGCTITVDVTGATAGEHINNIPAGDLQTSVGNNQQPANSSLLISPLGFISGKVFQDNNLVPNGTYETSIDTVISGVSIELHRAGNCSGTAEKTVLTDSLGNYLFAELTQDVYSICERIQPTGTINGIATAGPITFVNGSTGTQGTASLITDSSSFITGVELNSDGGSLETSGSAGNDFAEVVPSTISGFVFLDQNNNGLQNGVDNGIAGVTIELLDNGDSVITSTTTDSNGNYSFAGLEPGTYSVRQPAQPTNTSNGLTIAGSVANGGTSGTATTPTTVPSLVSGIVLPPNTTTSDNNFAEIDNSRRISGEMFLDYDDNGSINGSDHGIDGQTVNLTGTDINGNSVSQTTTTNSQGEFSFTGLPEGTYTLTQPTQPSGTSNGKTLVGSTGGAATLSSITPSAISAIDLTGTNTVSGSNRFAEVPFQAVDLGVQKNHYPASLGEGSNTGYYRITPSNVGTLDTSGTITIVDTLPAGIIAHAWPTSGDWTCVVTGQVVTCTSAVVITAGGAGSDIILRVAVANGLAGQILINRVVVSGGGEPPGFDGNNEDDDPTTVAASAAVEGRVWQDIDHDRVPDAGETLIQGWTVELLLNDILMETATTDTNGQYSFTGLAPGSGYRVRFKEPTTGAILGQPVPNETGASFVNDAVHATDNPAGADNSDGSLNSLTLPAGVTVSEHSLPLDPNGVIYDSITRLPLNGTTIQLLNGGIPVDNSCLVGANNTQVTGANGFYQFMLINPAPGGCPGSSTYSLAISNYPGGYLPQPSTIIPVTAGPYSPVADVAPNVNAIQAQNTAPAAGDSTIHYFDFNLTLGGVGVVNNHIPIDPILEGALAVTKTSFKKNVVRGEIVPYTVTATNTLNATLSGLALQDQIPPGFKYIAGSSRVNGVLQEPVVNGRNLTWSGLTYAPAGDANSLHIKTLQMMLIVGSGVSEGVYTNQAWAEHILANARISNVATAVVNVIPDPLFDCSDLIGKVFDDLNINGYQDEGEPGLAGVRVATPRGLLVTTDQYGRFHIACADVPNELHGGNFIMKLDERTLPSGYRVTTENPRIVRLTRGKLVKLNFGAALHKVLRIDIDRSAFNVQGEQLTADAQEQLLDIIEILKQQPTQVRLSYAQQPQESDAESRQQYFVKRLSELWQACECERYELTIETEMLLRGVSASEQNNRRAAP